MVIHESKKFLVLVSPYIDLTYWEVMRTALRQALERGVKVTVFTRHDLNNSKSWEQVESLGIQPKLVKNLHAKLYFSESRGLVSSMNLLGSSNQNAIEFGLATSNNEDVNELKTFVKNYLQPNVEKSIPDEDDLFIAKEKFDIILSNFLSHNLERDVRAYWKQGRLIIQAGNQYSIDMDKGRNSFVIGAILSQAESQTVNEIIGTRLKSSQFGYEVGAGYIIAVYQGKLSNSDLNKLRVEEKKLVCESALDFISAIRDFKEEFYQKNYVDARSS